MGDAIKSEFRKLLTVRSTYIIAAICIALTVLFAYYAYGIKAPKEIVNSPTYIGQQITAIAGSLAIIVSLVGVLLVTHEYRYLTIMYTLMAAKKRWQIVAAKCIVITVFALVFGFILCILAPLLTQWAIHNRGLLLVPQQVDFVNLMTRALFHIWVFSMLAFILAVCIRSQVGVIVILFAFSSLGELLLSLVLNDNAKYLPFTAIATLVQSNPPTSAQLSYAGAYLVGGAYVLVGLVVSLILFTKRDAN